MKFSSGLAIFCLTLLWWGPAAAEPIGGNDREVQAAAEPVLDTVLQGFKEATRNRPRRD